MLGVGSEVYAGVFHAMIPGYFKVSNVLCRIVLDSSLSVKSVSLPYHAASRHHIFHATLNNLEQVHTINKCLLMGVQTLSTLSVP